ncbi:3-oxoadipyl-CoA thiolase [Arenibaculum sp.]|uniref:3-oxoadipyl-CoA thiolase n=1 Tax=Arenibaculum sp. TaxID=2865862 RepID=UPI002E14CCE6|nr:3-oxoadipyl-CoA thiolase [Arenibaculum sp.]
MDAYIYDGLRTPFGRHAGALSAVRPDDLLAHVIRRLMARSPFDPAQIEDVVAGCTNQAGEDSRNVARHAALLAGLPSDAGGITVNRLCGSGLSAVLDAARAAAAGQGALFVAGGVESMSRAPFVFAKSETPFSREARVFDSTIGSRFPNPGLVRAFGNDTMPETADNVARDLGIGREDSDRFAHESQRRFAAAAAAGFFEGEIAPVEIPGRKGSVQTISADEHPRPDTTIEKLASLKPLFEGGVVTAGNASGINDGAAALLVGTDAAGEAVGAAPLARIVSAAIAGVEPRVMGLGPVPAGRKALERAGLRLADMDVIEINEAFATQVLGCLKLMEVPFDDARVNPNGGAIAVGHPLGASGARLALTAARQLQRTGGRYALVAMCIGVGQGVAAVLERV